MVAALKEPVEDSDDDNDDGMETEGDGPLWQLFDQLYNASNSSGEILFIRVNSIALILLLCNMPFSY